MKTNYQSLVIGEITTIYYENEWASKHFILFLFFYFCLMFENYILLPLYFDGICLYSNCILD